MIAAIRSLQEQINSQQDAANSSSNDDVLPGFSMRNHLSALGNSETEPEGDKFKLVQGKRKNNKKQNKQHSSRSKEPERRKKVSDVRLFTRKSVNDILFKNISVSGDSHARHLAGMIKDLLPSNINVRGMCKPGAGLLSVAPQPSVASLTDHCHILLAGSNDVANGRTDAILNNMESIIQRCSTNSKLLVVTLPHRYDLAPSSPVNRTIKAINNYFAEICRRQEGVELLEFGGICRSKFTTHGMHLRMRGKKTLARMIVEKLGCLMAKKPAKSPTSPLPAAEPPSPTLVPAAEPPTAPFSAAEPSTDTGLPAAEPPSAIPLPFVLPHNSYADAVTARNPLTTSFLEELGPQRPRYQGIKSK